MRRFEIFAHEGISSSRYSRSCKRLALIVDLQREALIDFNLRRVGQRHDFQILPDWLTDGYDIHCTITHDQQFFAEHLRLLASGGIRHFRQVLLLPAILVLRPESRLVYGTQPVTPCGQFVFGFVLIVFAFLLQILRFTAAINKLQWFKNMQTVGINRFGSGIIVTISKFGFKNVVSGNFVRRIHPKFVCGCEGRNGNKRCQQGFLHG